MHQLSVLNISTLDVNAGISCGSAWWWHGFVRIKFRPTISTWFCLQEFKLHNYSVSKPDTPLRIPIVAVREYHLFCGRNFLAFLGRTVRQLRYS